MPTVRLPLVGSYNQRGIDGEAALSVPEDQRFLNCSFTVIQNPVTGKNTVYVERRPGWSVDSIIPAMALNLPGASGDYASTPDSSALDITGDIEFIAYIAADDWTPAADMTVVGKWQTAGQLSYRFLIQTTGRMIVVTTADGSTNLSNSSSAAPAFVDGSGYWLRWTIDVNDGAGNRVYNYYYSTDSVSTPVASLSWTQVGTTNTVAGTTSLFSSTSQLEVGSSVAGTAQRFDGKIYKTFLYNGIGGTLVASFDANDYVPGIATVTSSATGEVYTLAGNASMQASGGSSIGEASTGLTKPQAFNATLSAFGDTNSEIFVGTISVGSITGRALHFTETMISGSAYVMIRSSDGTGWYYVDGAKDDLTYVGDTHDGTAVIDSLDSTTGIYPGQAWLGTGVAAGARVLTVDSASQITLNANCSADGTDITFTKTPVAKILDSDFVTTGTYISAFAEMDGYLFYATDDGKLRNSDLNSVTAYTSTNFISPAMAPDKPIAVARQKNAVVCFGAGSSEKFYNAGNATGSPLQRMQQYFEKVGTIDQRSVTSIEDDIFYVSSPMEGDVGVWMMRGLQSKKISTATMDNLLGTVSVDGAIYASSFRLGGQAYAAFYLSSASDGPASSLLLESGDVVLLESGDEILLEDTPAQVSSFVRLYVYNIDLNIWGEWDCDEATFIDAISTGTANQLLAASRANTEGKIYTINPVANGAVYQDDGDTYDCQIRTARIDHGTGRRKFIPEIKLICDRQDAGTVLLEASDDDYRTWFTLGTFDLTQMEPKITRCGSYVGGRAYRLTHAYNGAFRAEALDITFDVAKQ